MLVGIFSFLVLYLEFLNIFLMFLRLFLPLVRLGQRKLSKYLKFHKNLDKSVKKEKKPKSMLPAETNLAVHE